MFGRSRFGFNLFGAAKPTALNALTLSGTTVAENTAADTLVGTVGARTTGSALELTTNPGTYFYLFTGVNPAELRRSATLLDYETMGVDKFVDITITETLAGATGSPKTTAFRINVTDVLEGTTKPSGYAFMIA